jgi:hypothetical protein
MPLPSQTVLAHCGTLQELYGKLAEVGRAGLEQADAVAVARAAQDFHAGPLAI